MSKSEAGYEIEELIAAEEARRACRRDDKLLMPRVVLAIILTSQGLRDAAEDAMADAKRIHL